MFGGDPVWPVDLGDLRLWPMESEDGPLLQELLDDLADFRTPFGEPGRADAVSTFVALPQGVDYDAKLLVGVWRNGLLIGALDCIVGYPDPATWSVGLLVVADRHRGNGVGSAVLGWLERTARDRGVRTLRAAIRRQNVDGQLFVEHHGWARDLTAVDAELGTWTKSLSAG
ncbi:GNAT superfamily N-acetyltransferase [Friedmanniella endophytica]|uniref:GNAT superfamily N-acetyltransferase n=1 Tax=Microlunatus kandeliicorticis TaxID=1759536 RepID=A0A7W3P6C4_9ACTN|nr:GNAT family N-acetyltransferase [Microlunatus kandeliicorticis]MBA8794775.1 GNAT superfamily N-acetyltransferase [Microlunatus kandeliicorticis]